MKDLKEQPIPNVNYSKLSEEEKSAILESFRLPIQSVKKPKWWQVRYKRDLKRLGIR